MSFDTVKLNVTPDPQLQNVHNKLLIMFDSGAGIRSSQDIQIGAALKMMISNKKTHPFSS